MQTITHLIFKCQQLFQNERGVSKYDKHGSQCYFFYLTDISAVDTKKKC